VLAKLSAFAIGHWALGIGAQEAFAESGLRSSSATQYSAIAKLTIPPTMLATLQRSSDPKLRSLSWSMATAIECSRN